MSIDANAFALAASGTLRGERDKNQQPTEGNEPQQGNRNALALVVLELSERKNQKPQQKERNRNKGIKTKQGKTIVLQIVV